MQRPFSGLISAPFTPFYPDGSLNLNAIPGYAAYLAGVGVTAVFICGTTGEGTSLTTHERKLVAEKWVEASPASLRTIVHVGHACLSEARELAAHAQSIGAAAVGFMAPFFFKPRNTAELVNACACVAEAAPEVPFYYYHIPSMTGVTLPAAEFCAQAAPRIPNLAGVKFTYENLADFADCIAARGPDGAALNVLFGRDEILLQGWGAGARGFIGSTYNFAAPLYMALLEALENDDVETACELQSTATTMINECLACGVSGVPAFKALMPAVGVDCGPVRLPLTAPTAEQTAALRKILASTDMRIPVATGAATEVVAAGR